MEDTINIMQNMLFNHIACLLCIFGIPGSGAFLFVSAMVVPEYIEDYTGNSSRYSIYTIYSPGNLICN